MIAIHIILACALVLVFSLNKGHITKILTNRVIVFWGNINTDAYLVHFIVIRYADMLRTVIGISLDGKKRFWQ